MKKNIAAFFVLFTGSVAAQQTDLGNAGRAMDNNGTPFAHYTQLANKNMLQNTILSVLAYDSIRGLNEINTVNADAYPWISGDGLRLYYTYGGSGSGNLINYTERTNTGSYFTNPVAVSLPSSISNLVSAWLSHDELDMYVCSGVGSYVYYLHRNTIGSPFINSVTLGLANLPSISFLSGVSLDSSQNQMYAYMDFSGQSQAIGVFSRTSPTNFTYGYSLALPPLTMANPGQLSKDALTYTLSTSLNGANPVICQMTRAALTDTFNVSAFQQVQGINELAYRNIQPSSSDSAEWVAFVRATANSWVANDLFIAHKGLSTSVFDPVKIEDDFIVYPNPASESLVVEVENFMNGFIQIYDIRGNLVICETLSQHKGKIDISHLRKGVYIVNWSSQKGVLHKKLIKN